MCWLTLQMSLSDEEVLDTKYIWLVVVMKILGYLEVVFLVEDLQTEMIVISLESD